MRGWVGVGTLEVVTSLALSSGACGTDAVAPVEETDASATLDRATPDDATGIDTATPTPDASPS